MLDTTKDARPDTAAASDTHAQVQRYYGEVLGGSADLKTSACCSPESLPRHARAIAAHLPDEVLSRFYGCGSPIPSAVEGLTVLDLGCGTGRDAFILSKLVGPQGRVIGVDMTAAQLDVARRHQGAVAAAFGYAASNVTFLEGRIEDLAALGVKDASIDVAISNCVLNLAPDKAAVFREIWRVLKPGGELYFSDVFADRRLPAWMRSDATLVGECLGGAMYAEDFRRLMAQVGCADVRTVGAWPIAISDPEIAARIGNVRFTSRTLRALKLDLEDRCEDYGQVAVYLGGMAEDPHKFVLDDHHTFEAGRPMLVCGNTAAMLSDTRYGKFFRIDGDRSTHFGLFDCGPAAGGDSATPGGGCC